MHMCKEIQTQKQTLISPNVIIKTKCSLNFGVKVKQSLLPTKQGAVSVHMVNVAMDRDTLL